MGVGGQAEAGTRRGAVVEAKAARGGGGGGEVGLFTRRGEVWRARDDAIGRGEPRRLGEAGKIWNVAGFGVALWRAWRIAMETRQLGELDGRSSGRQGCHLRECIVHRCTWTPSPPPRPQFAVVDKAAPHPRKNVCEASGTGGGVGRRDDGAGVRRKAAWRRAACGGGLP